MLNHTVTNEEIENHLKELNIVLCSQCTVNGSKKMIRLQFSSLNKNKPKYVFSATGRNLAEHQEHETLRHAIDHYNSIE